MGWLDSLFSGLFGTFNNERQINANKAMQEDAQAFNFEMQKDAQRYNSAEAEKAFARQEEFYVKYSSPAAQIASLREAGVNPFSAAGAGNGPVASSSAASSGAASSGIASPGSLSNPLDAIIQMARLKMEHEANAASVAKTKAETKQIETDTSWIDQINFANLEESRQRISESVVKIENMSADTEVKSAQLGQIAAGIANSEADTAVKQQQYALMFYDMLKAEKSLDVMDAQIRHMNADIVLKDAQTYLTRSQDFKFHQEWRNLSQQYSHNEIMNAFEQVAYSRETGEAGPYYRVVSEVKRFINSILGWFSGGASVVFKKD